MWAKPHLWRYKGSKATLKLDASLTLVSSEGHDLVH